MQVQNSLDCFGCLQVMVKHGAHTVSVMCIFVIKADGVLVSKQVVRLFMPCFFHNTKKQLDMVLHEEVERTDLSCVCWRLKLFREIKCVL